MTKEVKVKFYSKLMGVGYNDWRKVFCEKTKTWMPTKKHAGRLVFGKDRTPFSRIRENISHKNFTIKEFFPF